MRSSMLSGKSIGLKDNVCGQIGVIKRAGISGCTSEPPAEMRIVSAPSISPHNNDLPNKRLNRLALKQSNHQLARSSYDAHRLSNVHQSRQVKKGTSNLLTE